MEASAAPVSRHDQALLSAADGTGEQQAAAHEGHEYTALDTQSHDPCIKKTMFVSVAIIGLTALGSGIAYLITQDPTPGAVSIVSGGIFLLYAGGYALRKASERFCPGCCVPRLSYRAASLGVVLDE